MTQAFMNLGGDMETQLDKAQIDDDTIGLLLCWKGKASLALAVFGVLFLGSFIKTMLLAPVIHKITS